jgi:Rab proteins geranylgeranyltransferase component A
MSYIQRGRASSDLALAPFAEDKSGRVLTFPAISLDLAFDDALLDSVKAVWGKIMGEQADYAEFLRFTEREHTGEDDE